MNLSIWIVIAVVLFVLLWFYRKKHSTKPIRETKINVNQSSQYAFSDTEKMISKLQGKDEFKTEESINPDIDNPVGSVIEDNSSNPQPKNPLSDPIIGAFILSKKKK